MGNFPFNNPPTQTQEMLMSQQKANNQPVTINAKARIQQLKAQLAFLKARYSAYELVQNPALAASVALQQKTLEMTIASLEQPGKVN